MKCSIFALGGVGEIGMNMYVYESEHSAVIVDCGMFFADPSFPGIDYIIPDFTALDDIADKLAGIVLTHGHEDHIGAIPYLLKRYNLPIYGPAYAIALLEPKLTEHRIKARLNKVKSKARQKVGDFTFRFLPVTHSIADTFALLIRCDDFTALHASDFKMDQSPAGGEPFDPTMFTELARNGVTVLLSDSTNALSDGFTGSETSIRPGLEELFSNAKGRVFFTTFASNIYRFMQVIDVARAAGRKVVIEGLSIEKNMRIAQKLGYINVPSDMIIDSRAAKKMDDSELCYMVTGCQGEPNSALYRISMGERRDVKPKEGDFFIISARVIPGNERSVNAVINAISLAGGDVVTGQTRDIHVSGHASKEELKMMVNLVRPKYFVPVHGENMHLKSHINLAVSTGVVKKENAFFLTDGTKANFDGGEFTGFEEVEHGRVFVDTRGGFLVDDEVLRHRKRLAMDGACVVKVKLPKGGGHPSDPPEFDTAGFVLDNDQIYLLRRDLFDAIGKLPAETLADREQFNDYVNRLTKRFFKKKMDRKPFIMPVIMEV